MYTDRFNSSGLVCINDKTTSCAIFPPIFKFILLLTHLQFHLLTKAENFICKNVKNINFHKFHVVLRIFDI